MRNHLVTAGVVVAVAGVWAIGLGLVDRAAPPAPRIPYTASTSARLERRPALFVIARDVDGSAPLGGAESGSLTGIAVPIALVEQNGDLRPPLAESGDDVARGASVRAFADAYYGRRASIQLLRGGAAAGSMHVESSEPNDDGAPVGRGVCIGPDLAQLPQTPEAEIALGVSDARLGEAASAALPMRAAHRTVAEQLARRAVADAYPNARVDETGVARIKAADFNRDGRAEIVASSTFRVHLDAKKTVDLTCFLLAEPKADAKGDAQDAPYAIAFVHLGDTADSPEAYAFVDEADLSAAPYDELVVRASRDDGPVQYLVLRRNESGWHEAYRTGKQATEVDSRQ